MRCFTKITDTKFARTSIPTTKTMRACCSDAGDFQRPSREISLGIDHILLVADTTKPVSKHKNTTLSGGVFFRVRPSAHRRVSRLAAATFFSLLRHISRSHDKEMGEADEI